jgi:OmpA-OmpF porin, OOP family
MLRAAGVTILCAMLLGLAGCATPVSRVTLLPQAGGEASAVVVKAGDKTQVLVAPYQVAAVDSRGGLGTQTITAEEVAKRHPELLARQPAPAQRFMLNFLPGSQELTPESMTQLPAILDAVQARAGGELVVIGHTDSTGKLEDNDALSLRRAQAVRQQLIGRGIKPELVEAVGRGEREPLVPTADEVDEPRNRRAEIVIR